jgi:hypothetical protein
VGLFRDFLPLQQVCKSFFQSALGFSPAQGVFRCHFWLQCPFSPGCEDTFSIVDPLSQKGNEFGFVAFGRFGRYFAIFLKES